jgi:hypothetical protein
MSAALALRRAQSQHPDQWGDESYDVWDDGRVVGHIFRVDDESKFRIREEAETWIWSIDKCWDRVDSIEEAKATFLREYRRWLEHQAHKDNIAKEPLSVEEEVTRAAVNFSGVRRRMQFTAKRILIAISAVAVVALAIGLWSFFWRGAYISVCLTNNDVSAPEREPYEKAGLRIAENMVLGNLEEVQSQTTTEAKGTMTSAQLATLRQAYNQAMTTLVPVQVTHTYFLRSLSGAGTKLVLCPALASGAISRPEDKVFVAMKSGGEQAHIVVEGNSNNTTWTFVLWLMLEEGAWRMQSLFFGPAAMFGKSAGDYWGQAREQRDAGHTFNAAILYSAANGLAFRGPNFQLGIWREIQSETKNLRLPAELVGQAPYHWQFGTDSYRVLGVQPVFAGGETDLTIRIEVSNLNDAKLTDELNHGLIRHLTDSYPELFESFEAIVVQAVEPGGVRTYRTVEYGHKVPEKGPGR